MPKRRNLRKKLPEDKVINYIKKAEEQEEEIQLQKQIIEYEKYEILKEGNIPKYLTNY
tara:strand:+ start:100 stop:273 length:174 start_codon:yes stop_codon:yes gene_type:complete